MRNISLKVRITVHVYSNEKLCDEVLLDVNQRSAIIPPEVMNAVCGVKDQVFDIDIDKETSVKDFENTLNTLIWGTKWKRTTLECFEFYYLNTAH